MAHSLTNGSSTTSSSQSSETGDFPPRRKRQRREEDGKAQASTTGSSQRPHKTRSPSAQRRQGSAVCFKVLDFGTRSQDIFKEPLLTPITNAILECECATPQIPNAIAILNCELENSSAASCIPELLLEEDA
eukprot:g28143.t1